MAVHAVCEFCGHKISVPDKLKGKKLGCPSCKKKTRVLTPLDLSVEEARRKHEESLSRKQNEKEQIQQEPEPEEKAQPVTRYPALRTFRAVFTFFAYLVGVLGIAIGVILFLQKGRGDEGLVTLLAFFVGSVIAFCFLKLIAESARLGADLGDMEAKMLEILFEVRDKLENLNK